MNYLLIFIGGGLGSALRYGMNVAVPRLMGNTFPWSTLGVNIIGCFVIGAFTQFFTMHLNLSHELRLFLITGILGGFTTFSAFALDFTRLVEQDDMAYAALYVLASVGLSILACFTGLAVVRAVLA